MKLLMLAALLCQNVIKVESAKEPQPVTAEDRERVKDLQILAHEAVERINKAEAEKQKAEVDRLRAEMDLMRLNAQIERVRDELYRAYKAGDTWEFEPNKNTFKWVRRSKK